MNESPTPADICAFAGSLTSRTQIWLLINELERLNDVRFGMITRDDVEDEYASMVDDGGRIMHTADWERFKNGSFWTRSYSDALFDGCDTAIRHELAELGLVDHAEVI